MPERVTEVWSGGAKASRARTVMDYRRRASVLILVMTLLSILFITGVAFLATMNFEAKMISADRRRDRNEAGVEEVIDELDSLLRDTLIPGGDVPFGGRLEDPFEDQTATAPLGFAELPAVHPLIAPIEPYLLNEAHQGNGGFFLFPQGTDIRALTDLENWRPPDQQVDTSWPSGIVGRCLGGAYEGNWCMTDGQCGGGACRTVGKCRGGTDHGKWCFPDEEQMCPGQDANCIELIPVDADGDGITDTFESPVRDLGLFGYQVEALSGQLNPPSKPDGKVYLGLRVIAHGGMVNLNESHPNLIANVFDFYVEGQLHPEYLLSNGNDPDLFYFRHRPASQQVAYSPWLEEPLLRRRGLLPPYALPPSLLHGNPLLDKGAEPYGGADMLHLLFPPDARDNYVPDDVPFETAYEDGHRYTPFRNDEMYNPAGDSWPLWAVRMEPHASRQDDPTGNSYDRRHLVTTVSYDGLLSRGGWVVDDTTDPPAKTDLLAKMREANRRADAFFGINACPGPTDTEPLPARRMLPFEYAQYPRDDLINGTEPNTLGIKCDCPTRAVCDGGGNHRRPCATDDDCPFGKCLSACQFDSRKGRLTLSLPWLDDAFEDANEHDDSLEGKIARQQEYDILFRLIHDVFMMLVRNARGPYWDEVDCSDLTVSCPPEEECRPIRKECNDGPNAGQDCVEYLGCPAGACVDARKCVGGGNDGDRCFGSAGCPSGFCLPDRRCYKIDTGQTHRESTLSRTAASLTANMLDYADANDVPTPIPLRWLDFDDPGSAGDRIHSVCRTASGEPMKWCRSEYDCGSDDPCEAMRVCLGGGPSYDGQWCTVDDDCGGARCVHLRTCSGGGQLCEDNRDCGGGACVPPSTRRCAGGTNRNLVCHSSVDCPDSFCPAPFQYVYGLERQPFITEVTTAMDATGVTDVAVELFNPYDVAIDLSEYYLVPADPAIVTFDPTLSRYRFNLRGNLLRPKEFLVYGHPLPGTGGSLPVDVDLPQQQQQDFRTLVVNGGIIFLVREVDYRDYPGGPGETVYVVVDQFSLDPEVTPNLANRASFVAPAPTIYTAQRPVVDVWPWKAPVPKVMETQLPSLGTWTATAPLNPYNEVDRWTEQFRPVEVNFANRDRFATQRDEDNPQLLNLGAFPTTGSMLLLMRHANRSLDEYSHNKAHLAFTTWLGQDTRTGVFDINGRELVISESQQIDNGRMPIFDRAFVEEPLECVGGTNDGLACTIAMRNPAECPKEKEKEETACMKVRRFAHHLDPGIDPDVDPRRFTGDRPGTLKHLPWGQLVFDYFTTLPLSSPGPYNDPDPDFYVDLLHSVPRVDQDGLRVHGRINLNAAPWKVLAGVPMVPPNHFPIPFQAKLQDFAMNFSTCAGGSRDGQQCVAPLECPNAVCVAANIGEALAQSIVAYRDARGEGPAPRPMPPRNVQSGDYADDMTGRGWDVLNPSFRRGTGFMTVGELANVRHELGELANPQPLAGVYNYNRYSWYRTDAGMVSTIVPNGYPADEDYVAAIALLASLSDWVTVRSDVFTVYGTLRGELDEDILGTEPSWQKKELAGADVDSRAIRFQETVDRLPTFLGAPRPVRIGERVIKPYNDVRND